MISIPKLEYSAVLTVYNAENTVGRALQSILSQTLLPAEILVIDDDSTDDSCEMIRAFAEKDKRISLIRNENNLGQAANRNLGVARSKCDFIIFFDDDDESLPERAAEHSKMIHSGATITFVSSHIHYPNGYEVPAPNTDYLGQIDFRLLTRKLLLGETSNNYPTLAIPASTLAVEKHAFEILGGFDPILRRLEDVDLALKFAKSRQIFAFSSAPLVARYSTISSTKGKGIDMKFEAILLSRYRDHFMHSEYLLAEKHCRSRQLYFSGKYLLLFAHLLFNPGYLLKISLRSKIYLRRLIHDYRRKSNN